MAQGGRKEGLRATVTVSKAMARLRQTQAQLNAFWTDTELCYAYVLSHRDTVFADPMRKSIEVLGALQTEVWALSSQGRPKHDKTVGQFLTHIERNAVNVHRSTTMAFYSAFEVFLDERVHERRFGARWGPLAVSLKSLYQAPCPIQLPTVLCADLARHIRNRLAHGETSMPNDLDSPIVADWRRTMRRSVIEAGWSEAAAEPAVELALATMIGRAAQRVAEAAKRGRKLPIDYFYMLFAFANLDSLAFEIEEALIPQGARPRSRVERLERDVRRKDLIVSTAAR